MRKIYVVWGSDGYESYDAIRAFCEMSDADDFVNVLVKYAAEKPLYDVELDDENWEETYDAWREKLDAWEKSLPGGEGSRSFDQFYVEELDLFGEVK